MRFSYVASLLLVACSNSHTAAPERDGGAALDSGTSDAGRVVLDAGIDRTDAGIDRTDAGLVDLRLGQVLSCELDHDEALRAVVRHVACDPGAEHATVVALFEAWEAGLLSQLEESGGLVEGIGAEHSCALWQCAARANDCAAYAACAESTRIVGACEPFARGCEGAVITRCEADGAARRTLFDCGALGASCTDGACAIGECTFGDGYYHLECEEDGALTVCDGALRLDCGAWIPGSHCESFHISGEVPTQWCSTTGESAYGAYSRPVDCEGGVLSFESASTRTYTLDCLALGYSGCEDRGCTL